MLIAAVVMMVAMCGGMLWMHGSGKHAMGEGPHSAPVAASQAQTPESAAAQGSR